MYLARKYFTGTLFFYAKFIQRNCLVKFKKENEDFLDYNQIKNASKFAFFQRSWSMVFVKKLTFLELLFLCRMNREKVHEEVLKIK